MMLATRTTAITSRATGRTVVYIAMAFLLAFAIFEAMPVITAFGDQLVNCDAKTPDGQIMAKCRVNP
jgi:hypothetical protein